MPRPTASSTALRATPCCCGRNWCRGRTSCWVVCTRSPSSRCSRRRSNGTSAEPNPEPVLDALSSRQKLSAEVARIREVLTSVVAVGPEQASMAVVSDFNDGPFKDLMENELLIKSTLDELVGGSFLDPNTYFKHAMDPAVLSSASTTRFREVHQDEPASRVPGADGCGGRARVVRADRAALSERRPWSSTRWTGAHAQAAFPARWYNLSNPGLEGEFLESQSMRRFVGMDLGHSEWPTRLLCARSATC